MLLPGSSSSNEPKAEDEKRDLFAEEMHISVILLDAIFVLR
jgi:hypothetical protein